MDTMKVLILAGGYSSRMGCPKHLLPLADGPLYLYLIRILHKALPHITTFYISLANRSIIDTPLREGIVQLASAGTTTPITIKLETISDDANQDIGPAAGLLAAYRYDPSATWLITACDYPLLQVAAVRQLMENYDPTVTCFKNAEGFSEPLLAIWSPNALQFLKENVKMGRAGPSFTVKKLEGKLVAPIDEAWLVNVNTKQDWEAAKARLGEDHSRDEA